jgi:hypothetical protein
MKWTAGQGKGYRALLQGRDPARMSEGGGCGALQERGLRVDAPFVALALLNQSKSPAPCSSLEGLALFSVSWCSCYPGIRREHFRHEQRHEEQRMLAQAIAETEWQPHSQSACAGGQPT